MSKEMEKLVNEIARRLIHKFGLVQGSITAYNLAERFIILMGKAYADGLELPREVGRMRGVLAEEIIEQFFPGNEGADELIALRKEEKVK